MKRDEIDELVEKIIGRFQELLFKASTGRKNEPKELYQATFRRESKKAVQIISRDAENFVKKAVPNYKMNKSVMSELKSYGANDAADIKSSAYLQIVHGFTQMAEHAEDNLKKYIEEENKKGRIVTIEKMRGKIVDELKNEKGYIRYANGARQPVDKYAAMVARTARIETSNVAMLYQALTDNNDLVYCDTVPNTCDICSVYQGRIYSISGKDKRYPSLYDTAFKKGYSIIHPNCRHQFFPYEPNFYTEEERKNLEKQTHRTWEMDSGNTHIQQAESARNAYAHSQDFLRQCNTEMHQYNEMQAYYLKRGEDPPYKSLSAFRRSYRAKKGTDGYIKSHYWKKMSND